MPAIRPVAYQTLVRSCQADGFASDRQRWGHLIYTKAGVRRPLVIPVYVKVPVCILKNLIRAAGMSRERHFALLEHS